VALSAAPLAANADEGAFSLDFGGGAAFQQVEAPYSNGGGQVTGFGVNTALGVRYALTNHVEFTFNGFYEPPGTYTHQNVTLQQQGSSFPGAVQESFQRFGAFGGVHYVFGSVVRLRVGGEVGWVHGEWTGINAYSIDGAGNATNYNVAILPLSQDRFGIKLLVGVEWCFTDHWSVGIWPSAQIVPGSDMPTAYVVPLLWSYSWYW
jgi:hypothetical protein